LGIAGILSGFSIATDVVRHNRRADVAMHLAQRTAEQMMALPSSHASIITGSHDGPAFDRHGRLADVLPSDGYRCNWFVMNYPKMVGMREVDVTCSWNDGRARAVTLKMWRE